MIDNKAKKSCFLLYFYAFLVIYTPNFFKNDILNFALPFVYWFLGWLLLKKDNANKVLMNNFIYFGIVAMIFFCIRALIAGVEVTDVVSLRIVQSISMIVSIYSFYFIERNLSYKKYNIEEKVAFLLNVCMIQFAFIFIMILFPSIRMAILERFYLTGTKDFSFTISKRVYGLMSNYTYAGSAFHGLMAFVALYFGFHYNNKFYYYIPFLLLAVFLNGRIGLIIFMIASMLFFIGNIIRCEYVTKTIKLACNLLLFILIAISLLSVLFPSTYTFFMNGFLDMINFAKTGVANTSNDRISDIDLLTSQFKEDINIKTLLLGNGHRIQNSGDIPREVTFNKLYSDIGYLNDMYMGGIIYIFFLYFPYFSIIFKKFDENHNNYINMILFAVLIVCNFKGESFRSSIIVGTIIFIKLIFINESEEIEIGESISHNGDV